MVAWRNTSPMPSEIITDPSVMSGEPVVCGTRILAGTIAAYLKAGRTPREIFEDYPTLPVDGIDAVERWAKTIYGQDWRANEIAFAH